MPTLDNVLLLNNILFAVPTTLVAVVDVVAFPLNAPLNVGQERVLVAKLNAKSLSDPTVSPESFTTPSVPDVVSFAFERKKFAAAMPRLRDVVCAAAFQVCVFHVMLTAHRACAF